MVDPEELKTSVTAARSQPGLVRARWPHDVGSAGFDSAKSVAEPAPSRPTPCMQETSMSSGRSDTGRDDTDRAVGRQFLDAPQDGEGRWCVRRRLGLTRRCNARVTCPIVRHGPPKGGSSPPYDDGRGMGRHIRATARLTSDPAAPPRERIRLPAIEIAGSGGSRSQLPQVSQRQRQTYNRRPHLACIQQAGIDSCGDHTATRRLASEPPTGVAPAARRHSE
jgi:hypothetical protein